MGACQSRASQAVIVDISNKPAIECSREGKQPWFICSGIYDDMIRRTNNTLSCMYS